MKTLRFLTLGLALSLLGGCANQASFQGENPYVTESERDLPANEAARLCIATARELERTGALAEAVVQYERARQFDSGVPGISRRLAKLYDLLDRYARAREEYQKALAEDPDDASLMNDYGYFHYNQGHLDQAEVWLRRAIDQDPFLHTAWVNLGVVLAEQERYKESLKAFEQVLPSAEAHYNLGVCLVRQSRYDEGREALTEALRLDSGLMEATEVLAWMESEGV